MSNYCPFDMRVRGLKKDILKLENWLKAEYDIFEKISTRYKVGHIYTRELYTEFPFEEYQDNDNICVYYMGGCKSSIYGSLVDTKLKSTPEVIDISDAAKILNLEIEIFATEIGSVMCEHVYCSPYTDVYEDNEYSEITLEDIEKYDDLEDYEKEKVTQEQFNTMKKDGQPYICISECTDLYGNYLNWSLI